MEEVIGAIGPVLTLLMPGFIAANVFYYFSDHPKPVQFERVVQALILTTFIKLFVSTLAITLQWIGKFYSIGTWGPTVELAWSLFFSLTVGLLLCYCSNNDFIYRRMRRLGMTSRSSYVNNWSFAFRQTPIMPVVLNLKDGRRLMGHPHVWADNQTDHFVLTRCAWIHADQINLDYMHSFLIGASEVVWVEFLKTNEG